MVSVDSLMNPADQTKSRIEKEKLVRDPIDWENEVKFCENMFLDVVFELNDTRKRCQILLSEREQFLHQIAQLKRDAASVEVNGFVANNLRTGIHITQNSTPAHLTTSEPDEEESESKSEFPFLCHTCLEKMNSQQPQTNPPQPVKQVNSQQPLEMPLETVNPQQPLEMSQQSQEMVQPQAEIVHPQQILETVNQQQRHISQTKQSNRMQLFLKKITLTKVEGLVGLLVFVLSWVLVTVVAFAPRRDKTYPS
eukprot:c3145_g1_i1.p1 GENE.c3145_g1_i1~~c3145_g1_i1.p1  ORF type:complete len:252 (+),score=75.19 c3145_g1_i1:103-858(+)